jgi:hypothetical protein
MPTDNPARPHTQTSAPVMPARTTEEAPAPRRDPDEERKPSPHASDDFGVGGDRMPKGFDEPGAGL